MKRKLSVILALDMADAAAAADTPGAQAALIETLRRAMGDIIRRHDGRVFNASGAAIFAEFGSSVEAVRCAVALLSEANDPAGIRVGLTFGDVVETEGNLLGDAVNIAARLASAAEPRSIIASALIHDQVRAKIAVPSTALPPLSLKNIAEPVAAVSYHPLDPNRRAPPVQPATASGVVTDGRGFRRPFALAVVIGGGAVVLAAFWPRALPPVPAVPAAPFAAATPAQPAAAPVAAANDDRAKRMSQCADILDRVQSGIATAADRKALQACR